MILVLSGPQASGKTSLALALAKRGMWRLCTTTTRPPRKGEKHRLHYYFYSSAEFRIHTFAEKSFHKGDWYGIGSSEYGLLRRHQEKPIVVVLTPKGAKIIHQDYADASQFCFILPPSHRVSKERIVARGQSWAPESITIPKFYNHILVNDDFDQSVERLTRIVEGEVR